MEGNQQTARTVTVVHKPHHEFQCIWLPVNHTVALSTIYHHYHSGGNKLLSKPLWQEKYLLYNRRYGNPEDLGAVWNSSVARNPGAGGVEPCSPPSLPWLCQWLKGYFRPLQLWLDLILLAWWLPTMQVWSQWKMLGCHPTAESFVNFLFVYFAFFNHISY